VKNSNSRIGNSGRETADGSWHGYSLTPKRPRHVIWVLLVSSFWVAPPVRGAGPITPWPAHAVADAMSLALPGRVQLQGRLGGKLDLCLNRRVWAQSPETLVAVLRDHHDTGDWRGEYWGKWYSAAVLSYACQPTPARRAELEQVMREVIKNQGPDGYLGSYDEKDHLTVWDIWCRKYVLLGLLAADDLTENKTALEAAPRQRMPRPNRRSQLLLWTRPNTQ
jgi:uncharacterized protein